MPVQPCAGAASWRTAGAGSPPVPCFSAAEPPDVLPALIFFYFVPCSRAHGDGCGAGCCVEPCVNAPRAPARSTKRGQFPLAQRFPISPAAKKPSVGVGITSLFAETPGLLLSRQKRGFDSGGLSPRCLSCFPKLLWEAQSLALSGPEPAAGARRVLPGFVRPSGGWLSVLGTASSPELCLVHPTGARI